MKLSISIAAAFVALAFVPLASANVNLGEVDLNKGPCIVYPGQKTVGGGYVGTYPFTVYGRSYTILFVTVTTQDVTVTGAGAYVPPVTVYTPGVCYGYAGDLLSEVVA